MAIRFLGLRVRILPGVEGGGFFFLVSVVCCQVEVSALGLSLVQVSPTKCGASGCEREASIMRGPRPRCAVGLWEKQIMQVEKLTWFTRYLIVPRKNFSTE